jgi:hypothetical protein
MHIPQLSRSGWLAGGLSEAWERIISLLKKIPCHNDAANGAWTIQYLRLSSIFDPMHLLTALGQDRPMATGQQQVLICSPPWSYL